MKQSFTQIATTADFKNERFGALGTFIVRLVMPVRGEMMRFIPEAEDLVVFKPDLYKSII